MFGFSVMVFMADTSTTGMLDVPKMDDFAISLPQHLGVSRR